MPVLKHIHTYVKYKERPDYWKCADPECTHFAHKALVIDKYTRCTQCGHEMLLTREDMRRVKPRCMECSNTKKAKIAQRGAGILEGIFLAAGVIPSEDLEEKL